VRRYSFCVEIIGKKRFAAGAAENVLGEHFERAGARRGRVLHIVGDGCERGGAFQHFEAVGGNEHALRGLLHAMIGAADALQQARDALGCSDIMP